MGFNQAPLKPQTPHSLRPLTVSTLKPYAAAFEARWGGLGSPYTKRRVAMCYVGIYIYMHTCMHAYIPSYIHTRVQDIEFYSIMLHQLIIFEPTFVPGW